MTEHPHRARRFIARGTLSVALVLALSGALFAANAKLAHGSGERHPQDLADLTRVEEKRVERLSAEVDGLHSDVFGLTTQENAESGNDVGEPSVGYAVEGGLVPVQGPGLTIRLNDAPVDSPRRGDVSPDVLVVHQQDIQAVMNALWAGGAEAMEIMDQRIISTSAIHCVGNVLRLNGRIYSPPYDVRAIGDPYRMRHALAVSSAVQAYVRAADDVGLGWSVSESSPSSPLKLSAYSGSTDLQAAEVPEGTEILPGLDEAESRERDESSRARARATETP
ncbi:DUF881 domain-containing protein [Cellulomonas sp. URHE0023]|uniref:DUF881 domain-containing protein n=1 Tax=Cellulomonas sp. URHE0023 TaxID=1380354 RepID=UPI0005570207|nr:DUF881 domain-containing protein [Cellulomonas sp. URHE0023]